MSFVLRMAVRFADVDPAGIVFYPRYFEMVNAALEDFFAEVVGQSFHTLHIQRRIGVPTVKLEADFASPGRLGDLLDILVTVERVGGSSAALRFEVRCAGATRLVVRSVIVCMDLDTARSIGWPEDIRARLVLSPAAASPGMLSPADAALGG